MPVYLYGPSDDGSDAPVDEDTYFCDKGRKAYPISEVPWHSFGSTRTNHWISHLEDRHRKATDSKRHCKSIQKHCNAINPKDEERILLEPILLRYGLKNLNVEDKMTTDVLFQLSLPVFVKFVLCHTIKDMLRLELTKESLRTCVQITYALQPCQDYPHSASNAQEFFTKPIPSQHEGI
jgi:hypothetical protein